MLFAEVDGKIAAVSVIVMEGFEGSLSEAGSNLMTHNQRLLNELLSGLTEHFLK